MKEHTTRCATCSVDQNDRLDAAKKLRFLQFMQHRDPASRLRALNLGGSTSYEAPAPGTGVLRPDQSPPPEHLKPPDGGNLVQPSIVTRAARREVILRNLLRNPVVNEDLSMVRAHPLAGQPLVKEPHAPPAKEQVAQPVTGGGAHPAVGVTGAPGGAGDPAGSAGQSRARAHRTSKPDDRLKVVPPPPGMSARDVQRLRKGPDCALRRTQRTDPGPSEGEPIMSEQSTQVDGLDDDAVAAVTPDAENQTAFIIKPDDDTVTVHDDQTPAPLK